MTSLITATTLEWPILPGPCGNDGPDGIVPNVWAAAQDTAVAWLWALSGRQFGKWTVVYRPEWTVPPTSCAWPLVFNRWPGLTSAPSPTSLPLPGPVIDVTEVLIDGVALPAAAWTTQRDQLVRIDGQPWPASQDTTLPATAPGTWQITYTRGRNVPPAGQIAAGVLSCEVAAAIVGDDSCQLPANTQSVVRNGVTINLDALQLQMSFTGLPQVDQWARTVNPAGRVRPATVWTPDLDPNLLPNPASLSAGGAP